MMFGRWFGLVSTLGPSVMCIYPGPYFESVCEQHGCCYWLQCKCLGQDDRRLSVNGVIPHSCTPTSKFSP